MANVYYIWTLVGKNRGEVDKSNVSNSSTLTLGTHLKLA